MEIGNCKFQRTKEKNGNHHGGKHLLICEIVSSSKKGNKLKKSNFHHIDPFGLNGNSTWHDFYLTIGNNFPGYYIFIVFRCSRGIEEKQNCPKVI